MAYFTAFKPKLKMLCFLLTELSTITNLFHAAYCILYPWMSWVLYAVRIVMNKSAKMAFIETIRYKNIFSKKCELNITLPTNFHHKPRHFYNYDVRARFCIMDPVTKRRALHHYYHFERFRSKWWHISTEKNNPDVSTPIIGKAGTISKSMA